jgi:RNA polymerase sigma factor (sigma-70 family)
VGQAGLAPSGEERETESDLLLRVRGGDLDAFSELVERNRGPALVVARSIVDAATAEDVVADSIERLLVVLKRGDGPTYSVRPYFLQMVRNRAIDDKRRAVEIPVDTVHAVPSDGEGLDEADSAVVRSAFEALPERWQTALWLGIVESRTHAEIGRELDVAEGAASQLLHRAREGLRQSYLDAHVGDDDECTRLKGLVGRYVRGRCSARDARKVKAHLDQCETCRAAIIKTRRLNARIGSTLAVGLLGGVGWELLRRPATAMAADMSGQPQRGLKRARTTSPARYFGGLAAGVVLVAGLGLAVAANGGDGQTDATLELAAVTAPASSSPTPTATLRPSQSASATPTVTATAKASRRSATATVSSSKSASASSTSSACPDGCPSETTTAVPSNLTPEQSATATESPSAEVPVETPSADVPVDTPIDETPVETPVS